MVIKILGSGCKNCQRLYQNVEEAVSEMNIEAEIVKVTDFLEIAKYKIMHTPGLVFDEKVVAYGRVLSAKEIKELLLG